MAGICYDCYMKVNNNDEAYACSQCMTASKDPAIIRGKYLLHTHTHMQTHFCDQSQPHPLLALLCPQLVSACMYARVKRT